MQTIDFLKHWTAAEGQEAAFARLVDRFGIKIKEYDDRLVLNYDMIESPKLEVITRECRCLILDRFDYSILARGFYRFFNYMETFETQDFDFSRAYLYDKIDGSYMPAYQDKSGRWNVATRKTAFGEAEWGDQYDPRPDQTFMHKFCEAIRCTPDELSDRLEHALGHMREYTFIFEMTSPETRVVTPYNDTAVYPIGIINKETGASVDPTVHYDHLKETLFAKEVKIYTFGSYEAIEEVIAKLGAFEEGFVAYDPVTGARVKTKNPAWVAIHHIRGDGTLRLKRVVDLVITGEHEEYLALFPEDRSFFQPVIDAYDTMVEDTIAYAGDLIGLRDAVGNLDRRDVFAYVKDVKAYGLIMKMYDGWTFYDAFERLTPPAKRRLIVGYIEKEATQPGFTIDDLDDSVD